MGYWCGLAESTVRCVMLQRSGHEDVKSNENDARIEEVAMVKLDRKTKQ